MSALRVLVTGGRNYNDFSAVRRALDAIRKDSGIAQLIHGGATGADAMAAEWADFYGVEAVCVPADWKQHGPAAGPIRNRAMLTYQPDVVVAFPGGRGTADMIRQAERAGIRIQRERAQR